MLPTLSLSSGTSLNYSPESFRSVRKMSCAAQMSGRSTVSYPPAAENGRKPVNFYEVLRVKQNASQMEIKTAYRTLAKIYHPDVAAVAVKHPEESYDGGADFIEIHKAYSTLSDPAAREMYDLRLNIGLQTRLGPHIGIQYSEQEGFRRHAGFYTTRRWETDQCW